MFRKNLTPEDANFKVSPSLKELMKETVTDKPGAVTKRSELKGDFDALASTLVQKFKMGKTTQVLPLSKLINFAESSISNIDIHAATALHTIIRDMQDILSHEHHNPKHNTHKLAEPALFVTPPGGNVASKTHPDGPDRLLCAYNGPTTVGLVNQPNDLEMRLMQASYKLAEKTGINLDPIRYKDQFSFSAGDIWKHAGIEQQENAQPFWHRGPHAKNTQARLLMQTSLLHRDNLYFDLP